MTDKYKSPAINIQERVKMKIKMEAVKQGKSVVDFATEVFDKYFEELEKQDKKKNGKTGNRKSSPVSTKKTTKKS